ncbi:MAG: phage major capsid protein [Gemmatimonadota bacterium]|nr:phage major capsid protein [Gemmatimonadota bacterium]
MLKSQKLDVRATELRTRMSEIADAETLTDELGSELTELRRKLRDVDAQRVAALEVEAAEAEAAKRTAITDPKPEDRERHALLKRSHVGEFLAACIGGREVRGAEQELREAYSLTEPHEIPLALFEPREERAVTPAPTSGTDTMPQPVAPYVYQGTVAAFLGVEMPEIGSGTASLPVLTTATPSSALEKDADAPNTAAAFTIATSTAKRLSGSFTVRYEDMATFPQIEDALRADIPLSIANTMDEQVINGSGSGGDLNGLLNQLTAVNVGTDVVTWVSAVSAIVEHGIDGRYASEVGALRLLTGTNTNAKFYELFRSNTDGTLLATWCSSMLGGYRTSGRIPDPSSDNQPALLKKGARSRDLAMPIWGGVRLIRDEVTNARQGQVHVTALQLVGDVHILRSGSIAEVSFHLA